MGGPVVPIYVHGLFVVTESELPSKGVNANFSKLRTAVDPLDDEVEGDVVDNRQCAWKHRVSLFFAAYLKSQHVRI